MSGTGWSYFIPYQEDATKALQQLRQEVFDRGDYERPRDALDFLSELENLGLLSADEQQRESIISQYGVAALNPLIERVGLNGLRAELQSLTDAPELKSLADLEALRCMSANGTHSIVDIGRVAPEPSFGCLALMPSSELLKLFGTDKPSERMVKEADWRGEVETGPRWQALYLVIYKEDPPDQIYVAGSSGD